MENDNTIEIVLRGEKDGVEISPQDVDIAYLKEILGDINQLVTGGANAKDRGKITVRLEDCCLRVIVTAEPRLINSAKYDIYTLQKSKSFRDIQDKRAKVLRKWHQVANDGATSFEIGLNGDKEPYLIDKASSIVESDNVWVYAELYLFGEITTSGGKTNPNYHLDTDEYGSVVISASKELMQTDNENRNYKQYTIHISCQQNLATGMIKDAVFIEWVDYFPEFDKEGLEQAIKAGSENWKGIDSVEYIRNLRGNDD